VTTSPTLAVGYALDERAVKSAEKRYGEICSAIRFTDDVSFKLLALVPTVSATAIFAVILKGDARPTPLVVLASLLGAAVTFALFRWELRNIQTCRWLQARAAELERTYFGLSEGAFEGRAAAPRFFGLPIGKTEAERIVYGITIATWLLLPIVLALG
jgi:hypothetical protein